MGLGKMGLGEMALGEMVLGDMDIHQTKGGGGYLQSVM
jgi:hypothetical protein